LVRALVIAGTAKEARTAIIAITTSSSIRVKPEGFFLFIATKVLEEIGTTVKLKSMLVA